MCFFAFLRIRSIWIRAFFSPAVTNNHGVRSAFAVVSRWVLCLEVWGGLLLPTTSGGLARLSTYPTWEAHIVWSCDGKLLFYYHSHSTCLSDFVISHRPLLAPTFYPLHILCDSSMLGLSFTLPCLLLNGCAEVDLGGCLGAVEMADDENI